MYISKQWGRCLILKQGGYYIVIFVVLELCVPVLFDVNKTKLRHIWIKLLYCRYQHKITNLFVLLLFVK